MKQPSIYLITNKRCGTLYVGVTSDLKQRIFQHKQGLTQGFSKKYNLDKLVYFEHFDSMEHAIHREKQLKSWRREWKTNLIEGENPYWRDLYQEIN